MSHDHPDHDFQRPYSPPPGTTEIMLVRHGSSTSREAAVEPFGLVGGHSDPPLSPEGHDQAAAVCRRLARERIDGLFVTTLQRTAQTAAPLATALRLVPQVVPELREAQLGQWEGEFGARIRGRDPLVPTLFAEQRWDVIPGAESMEAFQARVRDGLERIVETVGPSGTAVAVVHGGVIAESCRIVTECRPFAFLYADNASITRIAHLSSGRWVMRSFNDISHLRELRADYRSDPNHTGAQPQTATASMLQRM